MPKHCPSGKYRYADEDAARLALVEIRAANLLRRNRARREKSECRSYKCSRCKGWHLTSMQLSDSTRDLAGG